MNPTQRLHPAETSSGAIAFSVRPFRPEDASRPLGIWERMARRPALLPLALTVALIVPGCGTDEEAAATNQATTRPVVVSANYPLHYFAQRIGGDAVEAVFLVPADIDPAYWQPTPDDVTRMQQASLILLNGAGYEGWLEKVTLRESRLVNTSDGFKDQLIEEAHGVTHQHGPEGKHTHGTVAFTTWLDLSLATEQARAVEAALTQLAPERAPFFAKNLSSLVAELSALDQQLKAWGETLHGQPLIASHPVYQYLARRYGLNLKSLHWEPDETPDAAGWRDLDKLLEDHPANQMIWEGKPTETTIEGLAKRGVHTLIFDPRGNTPQEGDFISAMEQTIQDLQR